MICTEQRSNLFACMQTFSAICCVLGYPDIWTDWQIQFNMTASLHYFGEAVGSQVEEPRRTVGTAVQMNESHQLCEHHNLILPGSSHVHQLTESPSAIYQSYDNQRICMGLADILQDPEETHHITSGGRSKTDRTSCGLQKLVTSGVLPYIRFSLSFCITIVLSASLIFTQVESRRSTSHSVFKLSFLTSVLQNCPVMQDDCAAVKIGTVLRVSLV